MADLADMAAEIEREHLARSLADVKRARIAQGEPGECIRCGEDMPRLVGGWCAPCRDGRMVVAPSRLGQH